MALGSLPPWLDVTPSSFVQAGQEGANAGIASAHLQQSADQHSAQLGMEAQRLRQQGAAEAARLSQQEHLAMMEAQARKEIADQDFQRQQQKQLITNAYRQSQLGLEKSRLEQKQALADAVDREKAMTYAQESALAQHIAAGGDMATGLAKFPRARGIAGALKTQQESELGPPIATKIPGVGTVVNQKGTKQTHFVSDTSRTLHNKDGSVDMINADNSLTQIKPPAITPETEAAKSEAKATDFQYHEKLKQIYKQLGDPSVKGEMRKTLQNNADSLEKEWKDSRSTKKPTTGGRITVISPDGKVGHIPNTEEQIKQAIDKGYDFPKDESP